MNTLDWSMVVSVLSENVVYLNGMPGVGKTSRVQRLAKSLGADLVAAHLAQRAGYEIHGQPVVEAEGVKLPDGRTVRRVVQAPPDEVVQAVQSARCLLFFDEINQLSASDAGQVMTILSDRRWGGVNLARETIAIAAAGNPPEMSAGGWKLPLPVVRRIVQLNAAPDVDEFVSPLGFAANWSGDLLEGRLPVETPDPEEAKTDKSLPRIRVFGRTINQRERYKNRERISAWIRANNDVFSLQLKNRAAMSEGFVTYATLADAADLLTAVGQYVPKKQQIEVKLSVLGGKLGPSNSQALLAHLDNLDVLDAGQILEDPTLLTKNPLPSVEKMFYLLSSLAGEVGRRVTAHKDRPGATKVKAVAVAAWTAGMELATFFLNSEVPKDILCMYVNSLLKQRPVGCQLPVTVSKLTPLMEIVQAAGVSFH